MTTAVEGRFRGQVCAVGECPYCQVTVNSVTGLCTDDCPVGRARGGTATRLTNNDPVVRRLWTLLVELDYARFGSEPEFTDSQLRVIAWWRQWFARYGSR